MSDALTLTRVTSGAGRAVHTVVTIPGASSLGLARTLCGRPAAGMHPLPADLWSRVGIEASSSGPCMRCLNRETDAARRTSTTCREATDIPTPLTSDPAADRAARIARGRCVDCDDTRTWDDGTVCTTCREATDVPSPLTSETRRCAYCMRTLTSGQRGRYCSSRCSRDALLEGRR